jgi:hypothetical protein
LLKAEWTGGNAILYAVNEQNALVELQNQVFFYSHPFNQRLEKVFIQFVVSNKNLIDGLTLKAKAKLYNHQFKKIGKTIEELSPYQVVFFNDTSSLVSIIALIDKASIDPMSVPETSLISLMKKASQNTKSEFFSQFLKQFNLVRQDTVQDYVPFVFKQYSFEKHQFVPRLMMVFLHNELIAIFHTRALSVPLYDASEVGLDFGMIYNSKFNEHDKSTLMEIYKLGLQSSK